MGAGCAAIGLARVIIMRMQGTNAARQIPFSFCPGEIPLHRPVNRFSGSAHERMPRYILIFPKQFWAADSQVPIRRMRHVVCTCDNRISV
jgi:hypothetical protein